MKYIVGFLVYGRFQFSTNHFPFFPGGMLLTWSYSAAFCSSLLILFFRPKMSTLEVTLVNIFLYLFDFVWHLSDRCMCLVGQNCKKLYIGRTNTLFIQPFTYRCRWKFHVFLEICKTDLLLVRYKICHHNYICYLFA